MRDIQFSGFAKMLCDELEQTDALRYAISNWIDLDRKEVREIISKRAYDLVCHTINSFTITDVECLETHDLIASIPDMEEWHETGELEP